MAALFLQNLLGATLEKLIYCCALLGIESKLDLKMH